MANQPDINKVQRGVRIARTTDKKIIKKFKINENMTISDVYTLALEYASMKVVLTAEDYEQIADEIRAELKRRS